MLSFRPASRVGVAYAASYRCSHAVLSRRFPWGPSVSVNSIRESESKSPPALRELTVEMQSGDGIVVVAESFRLEWCER